MISRSDDLLSRIGTLPPGDGKVLASVSVGSAPEHLAIGANVIWVDDPRAKALYEVLYSG